MPVRTDRRGCFRLPNGHRGNLIGIFSLEVDRGAVILSVCQWEGYERILGEEVPVL